MTIDLHNDFKIERPPKDFYQVLVVDDEPASRNLLRVVLQKHGYGSVDEAASGKTQVVIKKLEVEAGEVVNLLVGGNAPSRKGPS